MTIYDIKGTSYNNRFWWDLWNRYIPNNETYGKFADPMVPMLLLNGDLDPQTPDDWAIYSAKEYGANIDDASSNEQDRYYYTVPNAPHFVMFRSPMINQSDNYDFESCGFWIMKSFINNDDWISDTECTKWMEPIDFEGQTNISKQVAMGVFGIDEVWSIDEDNSNVGGSSNDNEDAIIWVIIIGVVVILIEMLMFAYCDYRKAKNQYDNDNDKDPLLDVPTKPITYTDRY